MKFLVFILISLSIPPCLYSQTGDKHVQIQQLDANANLETLKKDYSVKELNDLPEQKKFSISTDQRDFYFSQAKLLGIVKKYDQLDRDLIFHITASKGAAACIKKYPKLKPHFKELEALFALVNKQ